MGSFRSLLLAGSQVWIATTSDDMIGSMLDETFQELDRLASAGDRAGALDLLISHFRAQKEFHLFFEAKLMKKRLEMGLPLIQKQSSSEFSEDVRPAYEQAMIDAARETGTLALEHGDIARAWPYLRAIGEQALIANAIEHADPDDADQIINIAFREGVHPTKGLELILKKHGMCQAITAFGMYDVGKDRAECINLLVRSLHAELKERILRVVEAQEGGSPDARTVAELITGRDWLFGEYDYYVDTSHLLSLLPYSLDVTDRSILELYHDLCEYGKRLSPMFQSRGHAPFDQPFTDYDHYVLAMLGDDVDARIAHFRKKIDESDADEVGTAPAQLLVNLALRLGRIEEALEVSIKHLAGEESADLTCPSTMQLCNLAKDYDRLKELARNRGDLLSYLAATADSSRT